MLEKYLNPNYIRTLLLNPNGAKQDCINFARFCAAYYLDFTLFEPKDGENLPSLYIWESLTEKDRKDVKIADRSVISQKLPVEYSPALPALLLVKCNNIIEAISYLDHFDDKRSALILRLLADSIYKKDLTTEYIRAMIVENIAMEIERIIEKPEELPKFTAKLTESILELDVGLNRDILGFLEASLLNSAEYFFSQLPLETSYLTLSNPVFGFPEKSEMFSEEGRIFSQIWCNIYMVLSSLTKTNRLIQQLTYTFKLVADDENQEVSPGFALPRVMLLMLRLAFRQKFSDALRKNEKDRIASLAKQYKILLNDEVTENQIIRNWSKSASESDMELIETFFDFINANFKQSSNLPALSFTTREIWLRRIIFNNSDDYRDQREERNIDWFRTICHPTHRVNDMTLSQMLFVNSQWSPPGFTFISPGCHALRLSIHPHDLCLGTSANLPDFSLSARDVLYTPISEISLSELKNDRMFSPRAVETFIEKSRSKTSRRPVLKPIDEKIREFAKQQDDLLKELEEERDFLTSAMSSTISQIDKPAANRNPEITSELSKQIQILTEKLDNVVRNINMNMREQNEPVGGYIREYDDVESLAPLDLVYTDHIEHQDVSQDVTPVEKLNFSLLSGRDTPLDTAKTLFEENPLFEPSLTPKIPPKTFPQIPVEWMKLLPLESSTSTRNILHMSQNEPDKRKIFSERAVQADFQRAENETQTADGVPRAEKKSIIGERRMSREDIDQVLRKVKQ
ncbi:unnamed protein product [Caenorhabditis angaria]|uniref:Uncharacterized protein n=1 Tax=Caenorhabditis angaria TaxID=860376 RepID=A0A9P1ILT4_9PELO|nr:unnamed protein product [Caenorhabditis angaria]